MNELKLELKKLVVKAANLDDVEPEDIPNDGPLFVEGLGLDSIDALELAVTMELEYGVSITDTDTAKAAFTSIDTLADFITEHRKK